MENKSMIRALRNMLQEAKEEQQHALLTKEQANADSKKLFATEHEQEEQQD